MTPSEEKQPEQKPLGGWLGVGAARLREQQASHEKYASVGSTMGSVHHQLQKVKTACYTPCATVIPQGAHHTCRTGTLRSDTKGLWVPGCPPSVATLVPRLGLLFDRHRHASLHHERVRRPAHDAVPGRRGIVRSSEALNVR